MKLVSCLENKSFEERLEGTGLFKLGERRLREDLLILDDSLTGGSSEVGLISSSK